MENGQQRSRVSNIWCEFEVISCCAVIGFHSRKPQLQTATHSCHALVPLGPMKEEGQSHVERGQKVKCPRR